MRLSEIWREAWLNICTGSTKWLACMLLFMCTVIGVQLFDVGQSRAVLDTAQRFHDAKANVLVLSAKASIDGGACERLREIPGVHTAGALRSTPTPLKTAVLPSAPLPNFEVTPGFLGLITEGAASGTTAAQLHQPGVWIPQDAATATSTTAGQQLALTAGSAVVAGVYAWPDDGRNTTLAYAVLSPSPTTAPFDECWVDAWPIPAQLNEALLNTQAPTSAQKLADISVTQLNPSLGRTFEGAQVYAARASALAPLLALLAAGCIGYSSVRFRRLELASALHAGASKRDLAAIVAFETAAWLIGAGVLSAAAVLCATFGLGTADRGTLLLQSATVFALALCGSFAGILLGIAAIKERALFRYFKDR